MICNISQCHFDRHLSLRRYRLPPGTTAKLKPRCGVIWLQDYDGMECSYDLPLIRLNLCSNFTAYSFSAAILHYTHDDSERFEICPVCVKPESVRWFGGVKEIGWFFLKVRSWYGVAIFLSCKFCCLQLLILAPFLPNKHKLLCLSVFLSLSLSVFILSFPCFSSHFAKPRVKWWLGGLQEYDGRNVPVIFPW